MKWEAEKHSPCRAVERRQQHLEAGKLFSNQSRALLSRLRAESSSWGGKGGLGAWDPEGSRGRGGLSQQEHTAPHWLEAGEKIWKGGAVGLGQRQGDRGRGPMCVGETADPPLSLNCLPTSAQEAASCQAGKLL